MELPKDIAIYWVVEEGLSMQNGTIVNNRVYNGILQYKIKN